MELCSDPHNVMSPCDDKKKDNHFILLSGFREIVSSQNDIRASPESRHSRKFLYICLIVED